MPAFTLFTSLCAALALTPFVKAQQYAGMTIPNSLPAASGAAVSYFKITGPTGLASTLINYMSAPNGAQQNPANVQRAIIVLHGANRDPCKPCLLIRRMIWRVINPST